MKLGILTRADITVNEMTAITHPIIKEYAKQCNAEFEIIQEDAPVITQDNHPHWRIAHLYNYYEKYDRILCLDSDVIITENCPNLFEVVPENCVGTIFEDVGSRISARRQCLRDIQNKFGDIGWNSGYINTGVFMTSKIHRDLFRPINGEWYIGWGSDDVHIGYLIKKLNFNIYELEYKFNHMTMFSESWNNNANRFNSYIIHYAGKGVFDNGVTSRLQQIQMDKFIIYN